MLNQTIINNSVAVKFDNGLETIFWRSSLSLDSICTRSQTKRTGFYLSIFLYSKWYFKTV